MNAVEERIIIGEEPQQEQVLQVNTFPTAITKSRIIDCSDRYQWIIT